MNQITIAGHLGADPEARFTSSGQKVTTLRVAARTRRGSNKEDTIWWRVTVWGDQFDMMIAYLKKGSPVIVLGELSKPEIFTDRDGNPQVSMNVTANHLMFSPFGRADGGTTPSTGATTDNYAKPQAENCAAAGAAADAAAQPQQGQGQPNTHTPAFNEDEIPF